jgi:DNA-binding NarL/FixJ family response regulator
MHAALHAVAEAEIVIDDAFADHLLRHPRAEVEMIEPLTTREREVLRLLASGLTNKEIAQRLGVTDHTIKFHVNGILGKLGAATRTEAVVEAARRGIIAV